MSEQLKQALSDLDEIKVLDLVQEDLNNGFDPMAILSDCRQGMALVGLRYESGEYFISDLIMAAEIFKQASNLLSLQDGVSSGPTHGKVVIGTVKGDIHDIGKDIVVGLLRANNYEVIDLGVNVQPEKFVETLQDSGATVIGLSCLLTTSFNSMKATVTALADAGLRSRVKIMIGGGPVTESVCESVGADAFGRDAQAAVSMCNEWI
jgi:methanogenic corrinoid protein MtbC1